MKHASTCLAALMLSFPVLGLSSECPDVSYKIGVFPDGVRAEEIPLRRGLREEGFKSWKDVIEKQEAVRASVRNQSQVPASTRTDVLAYLDKALANTKCWANKCPTNTTDPECVFYSAAPSLATSLSALAGTWKLVATSKTEMGLRSAWEGPADLWRFSGNKVTYRGQTNEVHVKAAVFVITSPTGPVASIEHHTTRWLTWKNLSEGGYYHLERVSD